MARETITRYLDDLDTTQEASETITLGYRGFLYELDLTEEHAQELDGVLEFWIQAAHAKGKWPKRVQAVKEPAPAPVKAARKPAGLTPEQRREAREWGRANGFQVAARGYLNPELVKAFKKAHRNHKAVAANT